MKPTKLIVPLVTGVLFAVAADTRADLDVTITGSTAFRSIAVDRIKSLIDGYTDANNKKGNESDAAFGACFFGTISNAVPSLGSTVVQFHTTFSGSAQGAIDVKNGSPIGVTYKDATTGTLSPDFAFADNWPFAQTPSLKNSDFADTVVGVNVFTFLVNQNLYNAGITNITRENARYLMTSSGDKALGGGGMTANYLGANITNVVYLLGRDIGSGTRITTFAIIGNTATPVQWAVNNSGNLDLAQNIAGQLITYAAAGLNNNLSVKTNLTLGDAANGYALDGYDSGGTLCKVVSATPNTIGYAGYPDATSSGNGANKRLISYQGIAATPANVESGTYPFWSYQHLLSTTSDSSKLAVKTALSGAILNTNFQNTATYSNTVARVANMQVKRLIDGGPITTKAGNSFGF